MNAQIGLKEIHGFGDNEEISGNTTQQQHPAQKGRAVLPIWHGVKRELGAADALTSKLVCGGIAERTKTTLRLKDIQV